jgi:uncharacterized protein (TIGR02246 family)
MRHIILATLCGLAALTLLMGQAPPVDEQSAIRAAVDSYAAAFNKGDVDGVISHFAADADFIGQSGKQYKGKSSLAELFKQTLADLKGSKLKVAISSFRLLRPDVAVIDGRADLTSPDGTTESGDFTAVWIKTHGQWLLRCVRDVQESSATPEAANSQLEQLEWLVGDWSHESPTFSVQISGRWTLNKNFLLLEYIVKGKDSADLTVVQYFAWDPIEGGIRSWFFDSLGGYGSGEWARDGNTWSSNWSGVLSEGQTATSNSSIKYIDNKSFLFRSVDREVAGAPMADVEATFIRKPAGK